MTAMQRRMLERLETLSDGTTMCPGKLARDCGSTLAEARPELLALATSRKIVVSQRGKAVKPGEIKGPFRVRLS